MINNILYSQQIAGNIENYLKENNLYYGNSPRENGDASWYLSLNNYFVTSSQAKLLCDYLPNIINAFHTTCSSIISIALRDPKDSPLQKLKKYVTQGVTEQTLLLWDQYLSNNTEVFSSRPDIVMDEAGTFHIIEYNTDGGADKGNTLGVNQYAKLFLERPVLGENLAYLFIKAIKEKYRKDTITVATVLPNDYRREYDAQNIFFARQASRIGEKYGIKWISVHISDIVFMQNQVLTIHQGKQISIDVIDREFKLPGFTIQGNFDNEIKLLNFFISKKVDLLGSILPFQDKILLSTIFNRNFSSFYDHHLLPHLRSFHAETAVLDEAEKFLDFGTETIAIDDIYQLRHPWRFVLKKGGDTQETTGSKGVFISSDLSKTEWQQAIDSALKEPTQGGKYSIIQRFYQSSRQITKYIKNSRSQPKELNVIHRIAPYYVKKDKEFVLGNILVTAGTDENTYKKNKKNIHGLKQNTYQAVEG